MDAAIAALVLAGTVAMTTHQHSSADGGETVAVILAAVASLPLLAWRRAPVAVFVVALLGSAGLMALGYSGGPPLGATVALYLMARGRDEARPWSRSLTGLVAALFAVHFGAYAAGHGGSLPVLDVLVGALLWALAWFAGDRTRLRRHELAQLRLRALHAERDAERDRRLAVAEERARIARDLHDSVAHAVNVVGVQAGAARLHLASDPARSSTALETIEEVARRTVAEIDQIVHGLRQPGDGAGALEPPPGLAALDELVAQHRAAGLSVRLTANGASRPLPAPVDRAAYRILQEALTNCARHGDGDADVQVAFGARALELAVVNPAGTDAPPRPHGGHGLVGMHERAAMIGGELAVARRDGTFRVRALLPYGAAA